MQDAAKIAGFAFDSLQGSNALGISPAAAAIATGALNGLGSGAQTDSDVSALIQSMVENALYTFQYAPARLLAGIPNFAQNSVPGKSGFVDPVLNAEASSVLEGIVKGAVGFTQKTSSQAHSQQAGAEDVAKNLDPEKNDGGGADSGTVATLALRVTAGGRGAGPLANISLVDMVARAVSRGIVNSYLAACRSANATPMTWLQLQEACRLAILNAYTALGLTVPVETFIGQVVQQMMLQNQQYRDLVKQVQGQDEAINGAGNPNLSGVGQNVGMARPVTDTVGR